MSDLERKNRKKAKRANLQKIVLGTVAAAGLLSVALIAPNAIVAMEKLGFVPKRRQKESIKRSRDKLVKNGLLAYEGNFLKLTQKGETVLKKIKIKDFEFKKPKKWDGKWRVLIFDIPEKRKGLREKLRRTLSAIGFLHLQDSVWVFPYPCEDLITLLKSDFKIGKDLLYMIVEELEYDSRIKKWFGLR